MGFLSSRCLSKTCLRPPQVSLWLDLGTRPFSCRWNFYWHSRQLRVICREWLHACKSQQSNGVWRYFMAKKQHISSRTWIGNSKAPFMIILVTCTLTLVEPSTWRTNSHQIRQKTLLSIMAQENVLIYCILRSVTFLGNLMNLITCQILVFLRLG